MQTEFEGSMENSVLSIAPSGKGKLAPDTDTMSLDTGKMIPLWADLLPDALAKVFSRLPFEDVMFSIPQVCRAWRHVSQDAVCWSKIDLDMWSRGKKPETMERMLMLLMSRSRGCLRELFAPNLANDKMLEIIAWSGSPLEVLQIPYSAITDECMCQLAPKFATVTFLDLTGCALSKISLEFIGKHCPLIKRLNLNTCPPKLVVAPIDDIALAVAQHMPGLKHLEMAYDLLSNAGLRVLLEKCTSLEYLDLRGCFYLDTEESFVKEARKRLHVFHQPRVENDLYYSDDSEFDASDLYDDSDFYDEQFWYDSDFEDLEDFMHEEEINGTLYFWPDASPSP